MQSHHLRNGSRPMYCRPCTMKVSSVVLVHSLKNDAFHSVDRADDVIISSDEADGSVSYTRHD